MNFNNLIIKHKKTKKWYFIEVINFGIGKIAREFDERVSKEENVITSIILFDRDDSRLKKHKFAYFPENKWCNDISLLDLKSIRNK